MALPPGPVGATGGPPVTAEPNACTHCGIPKREHMQRWKPLPVSWHWWAAPTDSQILARMKARRAARVTNSQDGGS
ncbi:hypothetical protein GCM10009759_55550 [Kitasatospora saccharophila]|uniref:Uncharacterized protein n=1 Tax=Kitasatospora saccharophila TaxID=407973 RepID=A0ABP5J7A3_9ACTN